MDFHQIWQRKVPQEAQAHDFLLHGLLSFAALHLSHLHGSSGGRYRMLADQERTKALESFQVAVSNVGPENCTAIFVFSLIVTMCQFALAFSSSTLQPDEQLECMLGALRALRGSFILTTQYWTLIEQGPLYGLLSRPRASTARILNPETADVLDNLDILNQSISDTEEVRRICFEAIQDLRQWYSLVSCSPQTWAHIVRWPATLSQEFFSLLEQRKQVALIILAHWCIPMHHAPYRWFVEDWARRAVQAITQLVDPVYSMAMAWPLSQVGLGFDFNLGSYDGNIASLSLTTEIPLS